MTVGLSPLNLTSPTGDMCFNSSEVVVTDTPLEFDKDGEWMGKGPPGFGVSRVPPVDISPLSSLLQEPGA